MDGRGHGAKPLALLDWRMGHLAHFSIHINIFLRGITIQVHTFIILLKMIHLKVIWGLRVPFFYFFDAKVHLIIICELCCPIYCNLFSLSAPL